MENILMFKESTKPISNVFPHSYAKVAHKSHTVKGRISMSRDFPLRLFVLGLKLPT
jgi:hypothetical protein